jgi:methyltransferase FkbM-like protein
LGLFGDFEHGGATGNAVPMAEGQPSPFKEVLVKKMTLDSWVERENLPRLDFIKIDIEGHEDRFIEGAKITLKKFRPYILGEFSENHMAFKGVDVDEFYQKFSREFNYAAYSFTCGKRTPIDSLKGRKNFEDVLFVPL